MSAESQEMRQKTNNRDESTPVVKVANVPRRQQNQGVR
jgi:hypothetical protein